MEQIYADEIESEDDTRTEGQRVFKEINTYERDQVFRQQCLEYYSKNGLVCSACNENIGNKYGEEYSGKIHVHHLTPMHTYDGEHKIDPIKDLCPVCPNCHMIIHCGEKIQGKPFSPEQIQEFIILATEEKAKTRE